MGMAAKNLKENEVKRESTGFRINKDPEINLEITPHNPLESQATQPLKIDVSNLEARTQKALTSENKLVSSVKLRIVKSPYAREPSGALIEKTLPALGKNIFKKLDVGDFIFMVAIPFALVTFLIGARVAFVILTSPKISLPELIWKTIWLF